MLRLGVIGYGDSARDFVNAAYVAQHWEAAGVSGRNMEKAAAFGKQRKVAAIPVPEMMERDDIDIIAISTPPGIHLEDTLNAIEHGKHVIVEKPMALTLGECDQMIAAAKKKGVVLSVSQTIRYLPGVTAARKQIETGTIGKVVIVREEWTYDYFGPKRVGWQLEPALSGGGMVFNPLLHLTDRARYFCGSDISSIQGVVGYNHDTHKEIDGDVHAFYRMKNGVSATILLHGYGVRNTPCTSFVYGTAGIIEVSNWKPYCRVYKNNAYKDIAGPQYPEGILNEYTCCYYFYLVALERAIREGTPIPSPGEDGRANVAAPLAILQSSHTKKTIPIT